MSDNVRSLHGAEPRVPTADPSVVSLCEDLLDRARSGQLVGIQVFGTAPDGCIMTQRSGICCSTGLIGELQIAAVELSQIFLMDDD